ncbi:MAG: hypothetical protein VX433_01815 [Candidatus Thermoplasmatota archaeon]|nr:hypothetical protein [Candidatus Thermoplasmatota archaeon]
MTMGRDGGDPFRLHIFLVLSLLILSSTPLYGEEAPETSGIEFRFFDSSGESYAVQDVTIQLIDPWSGRILSSSTDIQGTMYSMEWNSSESFRPEIFTSSAYIERSEVIHPNGTDVIVLDVKILIEEQVNLTGNGQTATIQTLTNRTIGWQSNLITNDSIQLPNASKGWIEIREGEQIRLIEWTGENLIDATAIGNLRLMASDSQWNGSILVRHSPSGWSEIIDMNGTIDHLIPRISGGEWHLWRLDNGEIEAQAHIIDDALFEDIETWLNSPLEIRDLPSGSASIVFVNPTLNQNTPIEADFSVNHRFDSLMGHGSLPATTSGIGVQIDRFHGNWDGTIQEIEFASFSAMLQSLHWWNGSHVGCCILDDRAMFAYPPISPRDVWIEPSSPGVLDDGIIWGWTESGRIGAESDNDVIRKLSVPFRGDSRDSIDLSITLPNEWEMRQSPQSEHILANANQITVQRSSMDVTGEILMIIAENEAPEVSIDGIGLSSNYARLGGPIEQTMTCIDSSPGDVQMQWQIIGDDLSGAHNGENFSITFDSAEQSEGDEVLIQATCVDSHGNRTVLTHDLVLDSTPPNWEIVMLEDHPSYWAQILHEIESMNAFGINATSTIIVDIHANDTNGEQTKIVLTSNRSEGWNRIGENRLYFAEMWPQGDHINGMHMTIEERHKEREPAVRWLKLEVSDSVGNTIEREWSVTSLDLFGPVPRPSILVNGFPIGLTNIAKMDSTIEIDMSESFDDLDPIDTILWSASINDVSLFENASWEEAQKFPINGLNRGRHSLVVTGIDRAGNIGSHSSIVEIHPSNMFQPRIEDVMIVDGGISGQSATIRVVIANMGSEPHDVIVCMVDSCDGGYLPPATIDSEGILALNLEFDDLPSGTQNIIVEWTKDGQTESISSAGPVVEPAWRDTARMIIWIVLIAYTAGVLFDRRFGRS